jgi:hypothetical protein
MCCPYSQKKKKKKAPPAWHIILTIIPNRYEKEPSLATAIFSTGLALRKFFLRYLALPRPYVLRSTILSENPDPQTGHHYVTTWPGHPYYVKPTLWNRWLSPGAIVTRLMGLPLPGDQGEKYYPTGYDLANVGPKSMEGLGKQYMEKQVEGMKAERRGQCPFH